MRETFIALVTFSTTCEATNRNIIIIITIIIIIIITTIATITIIINVLLL